MNTTDSRNAQWENSNELRAYPFEGYEPLRSDEGAVVPQVPDEFSVVADLSIFVPMPNDQSFEDAPEFRLSSLYCGPGLVSMSVTGEAGTLVCSVTADEFEPYRPYPMSSSGLCSGICSFGDVLGRMYLSRKYESGPRVLKSLVRPISDCSVISFVDQGTMEEVTGDVELEVPEGVTVEKTVNNAGMDFLWFSLPKKYDGILSRCERRNADGDLYEGVPPYIGNINGVYPNEDGVIALVFR